VAGAAVDDPVQHQRVGMPIETSAEAHPPLEMLHERVGAGRGRNGREVAEPGGDQVEPGLGSLGVDRAQLAGDGECDLLQRDTRQPGDVGEPW